MKLKRFFYLPLAVISTVAFTSCLNDDGDGDTEIRNGFASVINAMPDTSALDFYIQNVHLGDAPIPFTSRYPDESYFTIAGPAQYGFDVAFPNATTPLLRSGVGINADVYHSIYIYNTPDSIKGTVLIDDLASPAAGKAKVRFANFGTNSPAVDLGVAGETEAWFSDFEFEEASIEEESYVEVDAGIYDLEVRETGTTNVLFTQPGVELEDSKVYTLWIKGRNGGTNEKALGLESIEHIEWEDPSAP